MSFSLYILGRTALADAIRLAEPPAAGDVVCWLRPAQDADGTAAAALRANGINAVFADSLLDAAAEAEIEALGDRFLRTWQIADGGDISRIGDVSLATAFAMELARQTNPRVQIRFGEILRRMIAAWPGAARALTDIADGDGIFEVEPDHFPLRRVLAHVAENAGLAFAPLDPVNPLPHAVRRARHQRWLPILRSLLGGMRPHWLHYRRDFARRRRENRRPVFYMFLGREQHRIAVRLAERGRFHVVCDSAGVPGADAVRSDHQIAWPRRAERRAARALLRRLSALGESGAGNGRFALRGMAYGPLLYRAVRAVMASQMAATLLMIAQARRLQQRVGFDALFVNGGGLEPMGTLIAQNRDSSKPVYLMPHGMDLQRFAYPMAAADNAHVTYLAYGSDHAGFFRSHPQSPAPAPAVVGNPLTVSMTALRGRRDARHGKRLLILNFGHLEFWNAQRIYACDRYYLEVFGIARALIAEGWTASFRPHPYHPVALEMRIAETLGIREALAHDRHETFEGALAAHDVVVSSLSSACYQALCAGWPTILYEPDWRGAGDLSGIETDPMLTGLPTASDIERPVTNDPVALARMIRETLDPESPTSRFPEIFSTVLSERFIGPHPANADIAAATFIESDFFQDVSPSNTRRIVQGVGT